MNIKIKYRAYVIDPKGMLEQPISYLDDIRYPDTDTMEEMIEVIRADKRHMEVVILPITSVYWD